MKANRSLRKGAMGASAALIAVVLLQSSALCHANESTHKVSEASAICRGCIIQQLPRAASYRHPQGCRAMTVGVGELQYAVGEAVRLWVNKVGPYNNPQETYNYYHLPFCKPREAVKPAHKWGGLGEVLQGNELIDSQLDLKFRGARPLTSPT